MSTVVPTSINIEGVEFVRKDSTALPPNGNRAVIVVDRGWVWAGDVTVEGGYIKLSRAVWVFRWEALGFDGMIANPKDERVQLKPVSLPVEIPVDSEIFKVKVDSQWGL